LLEELLPEFPPSLSVFSDNLTDLLVPSSIEPSVEERLRCVPRIQTSSFHVDGVNVSAFLFLTLHNGFDVSASIVWGHEMSKAAQLQSCCVAADQDISRRSAE